MLRNYNASDPLKVDRARAALRKQVRFAGIFAAVFFLAFSLADLLWFADGPLPPLVVVPLLAFIGLWLWFGLKKIAEVRFQGPLAVYEHRRQLTEQGPVMRFSMSTDAIRGRIRESRPRQRIRVVQDRGAMVELGSNGGSFKLFFEQLGDEETYVLVDPATSSPEMLALLEQE